MHPSPPPTFPPHLLFFWGGVSYQVFRKGRGGRGTWQDLNFWRGVTGKEKGDFFQGVGAYFFIKNKLKSEVFREGGGFLKNQYIGGICIKREAWAVFRFRGELSKKEGVVLVFFGREGVIHKCTLWEPFPFARNLKLNIFNL